MVQIDPPALPRRLFRYRDVSPNGSLMDLADRELKAISENYLWCCHYRELNDPMEGVYGVTKWVSQQPEANRIASEILNQKRSVGICCFSDTPDNDLMWAHYANNFSGICVEYSTSQLSDGLGDAVHFVRLAYGDVEPIIGKAEKQCRQQAARIILSHKKSCWGYEREWRLLASPEAVQVPGCLEIKSGGRPVKAVYLGSRVNDDVRDKLENKLNNMNIQIHTMTVSKYDLIWPNVKDVRNRPT